MLRNEPPERYVAYRGLAVDVRRAVKASGRGVRLASAFNVTAALERLSTQQCVTGLLIFHT